MDNVGGKRRKSAFFENKLIFGPMVRVGTLPMRLMALKYGADLVYTEEIIDYKLIKSNRLVNDVLGTIDFVDNFGVVVFRTCNLETDKIGTNDPERAILAAKKVENDVAGIDINMGCPKSFSIKGGMGAALMEKPEQVKKILCSLKASILKPISCKLRVFANWETTLNLLKVIENTSIDAVAIHGRTKNERPQHLNRNDFIKKASEMLQIPVIANGDSSNINCFNDINSFWKQTKASSVMISRAAMKNCSIFDPANKLKNIDDLIREYLKLAIKYDNNAINTKYCILQMLGSQQESTIGKLLLRAYDLKTMSSIYQLENYYNKINNEWLSKVNDSRINSTKFDNETERNNINHIELPVIFDKTVFERYMFPKDMLNKWILKNNIKNPYYETIQIEKQFHSIVHLMNKHYSTPYLEKSKRAAEQSAALVAVFNLGLCNESKILEHCLIDGHNENIIINYIKHEHLGRSYLIKVNK